ncbi:MAG: organic solvent tolerance protein OstA, partial [Anaerophaga sp.]|nr:organic solvent tolerance protein OstA [Anaerophaga sp.]
MPEYFFGVFFYSVKRLLKTIVVLFFLLGSFVFIQAQGQDEKKGREENRKILIEYADLMKGAEKRLGKNSWALVGNVRMQHLNTRMFCDSAILNRDSNRVEAFG